MFERTINKEMTLFVNNEEPRSKSLETLAGQTIYFSVEKNEKSFIRDDFYNVTMPCPRCSNSIKYNYYNLESIGDFECTCCDYKSQQEADYIVKEIDYENKTIKCNDEIYNINYVTPFYIYNYCVCIAICKKFKIEYDKIQKGILSFINKLERREKIEYKGKHINYLRMKQENPETLQNALDTVAMDKKDKVLFIGLYEIKDFEPAYANTFYFFDCDFNKVVESGIKKYVSFSTTVCYDCANRMIYAGAKKENIKILDTENIELVMQELENTEIDNIYFITGMKPYYKIKEYLTSGKEENK